jgi:hypothetical protein
MAKVPALAKAFAGRWRIVEMDVWDNDVLDLAEDAHISFTGRSDGEIAFVAVKGFLDIRYGSRDGRLAPSSPGRATTMPTKHAVAGG